MKGIVSLRSVNFSNFCIQPGFRFPVKFIFPDFKKYDEKNCSYAHLKVYDSHDTVWR